MESTTDITTMDEGTVSAVSKPLIGLYIISFLSGFSMGIFNPLISISMEQQGIDQLWIGANSSLYYLMIAAFAPLAGKLIRHYGINSVMIAGILITALSACILTSQHDLDALFITRALMGLGVCFYMVGGQTGLNIYANHERRGVIVATHGAAFGIGFIVSPLVGTVLYAHFNTVAFLFGAGVILLGVLATLLLLPNQSIRCRPVLSSGLFSRISIPLHGAFIYGALEGILVTLLPVLLLRQAMPLSVIGLPLTLFMVASGVGMVPVSFFGDKLGRFKVLLVSAIIGLITLLVVMNMPHPYTISACAVLLGLSLGTFFPVTLAMIGEKLSASEMHAGSGMFTAAFSYGCVAGPLCSALFMTQFGDIHIFTLIIILLIMLILRMALKRLAVFRIAARTKV